MFYGWGREFSGELVFGLVHELGQLVVGAVADAGVEVFSLPAGFDFPVGVGGDVGRLFGVAQGAGLADLLFAFCLFGVGGFQGEFGDVYVAWSLGTSQDWRCLCVGGLGTSRALRCLCVGSLGTSRAWGCLCVGGLGTSWIWLCLGVGRRVLAVMLAGLQEEGFSCRDGVRRVFEEIEGGLGYDAVVVAESEGVQVFDVVEGVLVRGVSIHDVLVVGVDGGGCLGDPFPEVFQDVGLYGFCAVFYDVQVVFVGFFGNVHGITLCFFFITFGFLF